MPGYEVSAKLEKMGWHSSDTGELAFTDVEVPDENLLGEENGGFYLIMANFQWERLDGARRRRGMQRLFEATLDYAKEREAFGRPIGRFQVIRHKFAEMAVTIEAGRAMTYDALRLFSAGENAIQEVTMAKLFTQRAASTSPTSVSRSTAATATCASTGSSAPFATSASARSAAAPTRS